MEESQSFEDKNPLLKENQPDSSHMEDRNIESEHSKTTLRNTDVAFILTGIVTTVAGGPIITAWSAIFFFLGRENDVPNWLRCLAAFFCSALSDAFISNFSSLEISTGLLPYILFGFGTTISAVLDYDEFFRLSAIEDSNKNNAVEKGANREKPIASATKSSKQGIESDIQEWDKAFEEKTSTRDP